MPHRDGVIPVTEQSAASAYLRYRVLGFVCGLSMITYLDRVCFGAAAPLMAKELGLTGVAELKWAFTAFSIAYGLFEIPAGWLADRWGPRGTLIRIVTSWSLFTALTGLVGLQWGGVTFGGLWLLIGLRFLFGAGEAGAYPNITRVLHNWFPAASWETTQGLVFMSGRIAGGLTPFIWAVLVAGTDITPPLVHWRAAFAVFGVIGIAWAIAFARWFRDRPEDDLTSTSSERHLLASTAETSSSSHTVPWISLLKNRTLIALCLIYSLINYGWYFNITYLSGYLKVRYQTPDNDLWAAIFAGAPLWVGAVGCVAGGVLVNAASRWLGSRRLGRQAVCIPALLLCAACWWGARSAPSMERFCLLISIAAFGIDLTLGATWASCQDIGQRHAAVVAASMNMIGTFGSALAAWLTGTIVESGLARQAAQMGIKVAEMSETALQAATVTSFDDVFSTYTAVYVISACTWFLVNPLITVEQ